MTYSMSLLASCAVVALAGTAQADCAADLARLSAAGGMESAGDASGGISKDGSLAPLEGASGGAASGDMAASGGTGTAGAEMPASDMPASGTMDAASAEPGMAESGMAEGEAASDATGDMASTDMADGTAPTNPADGTGSETLMPADPGQTGTMAGADGPDAAAGAAMDQTADAGAVDAGGSDAAGSDMAAGSGEGIAKDGTLAPLEGTEAQPGTPVAMSSQDAQAQQEGEPTAAEAAGDVTGTAGADTEATDTTDMGTGSDMSAGMGSDAASGDRESLMAEAQAALDAGNEAECQAVVDRIEGM